MIAVDTNILVHAHRADSEWHDAARSALEGLDQRRERWAIPWPCVYEFFSIVTHPRIYAEPTPPELAWRALRAFVESESVSLLREEVTHFEKMHSLLLPLNLRGARIHDARIAVLCATHGIRELSSQDRDFTRFTFIQVKNPLVPKS